MINDILKYNAYREVASNYEAARDIIYQLKPAYGETAIVPFFYPDRTDPNKTIQLLMGVGSLNGNVMFQSNIMGSDTRVDNASVYVASAGGDMSVKDAIEYIAGGGSIVGALENIANAINGLTAAYDRNTEMLSTLNTTLNEKMPVIEQHDLVDEEP